MSVAWAGHLKSTHYWDCNGQGCDSLVLQPWDETRYWSPAAYAPQDPLEHGGPSSYGEKLWMVGAASDALAAMLGANDECAAPLLINHVLPLSTLRTTHLTPPSFAGAVAKTVKAGAVASACCSRMKTRWRRIGR